mgnify:CR=1 FL=1
MKKPKFSVGDKVFIKIPYRNKHRAIIVYATEFNIYANEHVYTVEFADGTRSQYMEMDLQERGEND